MRYLNVGKLMHLSKFPKGPQVELFRLAFSLERTDYAMTNELVQSSVEAAQKVFGYRWKVEVPPRGQAGNRNRAVPARIFSATHEAVRSWCRRV